MTSRLTNILLTCSIVFSVASLIMSVLQYPFTHAAIDVSNMIALVGICTTIIVCTNLYDSIAVKSIVKQQVLLQAQVKEIKSASYKMRVYYLIAGGLGLSSKQPFYVAIRFHEALTIALSNDDGDLSEVCAQNIETVVAYIRNNKTSVSHDWDLANETDWRDLQKIPDSQFSSFLSKRIEDAYGNIATIVGEHFSKSKK